MTFDLLVRADDAAGSFAANEAIADALEAGAVRNVSVMGCGSEGCREDFARRFHALPASLRAEINVGLHVTLNAEWTPPIVRFRPCLTSDNVPSLIEPQTGFFTVSPRVLAGLGWGPVQVDEAVREARAQLGCLRDAGFDPVYLDEHMGVGWLPGLRAALVALAEAEGLIPAVTLDLRSLNIPELSADAMTKAASETRPALLVLHPAHDGEETAQFWNDEIAPGQVAGERERERIWACDPGLASRLAERGIRLLRYRDITAR